MKALTVVSILTLSFMLSSCNGGCGGMIKNAQKNAFGKKCALEDDTGISMDNPNSSNGNNGGSGGGSSGATVCPVTSSSKSWGTLSNKALSDSLDSQYMDVSINDCKKIYALFRAGNDDMKLISYDSGVWSSVSTVQVDTAGGGYSPRIEFGYDLFGFAAWVESVSGTNKIIAMKYSDSDWESPSELVTGTDTTLELSVGQDNKAVIAWIKNDGGTYKLNYIYYNGTNWSSPVQIHSSSNSLSNVKLSYENGRALMLWGEWDGSKNLIWSSIYSNSSWSAAVQLQDANVTTNFYEVDINESGTGVAVWKESEIQAKIFSGGSWGAQSQISSSGAYYVTKPSVSINNSGNAVAVWEQGYGGFSPGIYSAYYSSSSWAASQRIESLSSQYNEDAKVEIDSSNNAVAVWDYDRAGEHIASNIFNGTSWGTEELISNTTPFADYSFKMDMNRHGDAFVIWNVNASWIHGNIYE